MHRAIFFSFFVQDRLQKPVKLSTRMDSSAAVEHYSVAVQETQNGEISHSRTLTLRKKLGPQSSSDKVLGAVTLQAAWCCNVNERTEIYIRAGKRELDNKLDTLARLEEIFRASGDLSASFRMSKTVPATMNTHRQLEDANGQAQVRSS